MRGKEEMKSRWEREEIFLKKDHLNFRESRKVDLSSLAEEGERIRKGE